ncbi:UDP-3-O-(3-hydroxymyristoyl) glucosamine N-acyltransferase [Ketogulonicigenium robustum]|uniref:UDP-3-O-(3-hydroxymyristoyl) glucosamine N-acyltransferase n=1 Tax=Ketogulonicigenium robustum TaxID=92947 RepID=A0A1W6NYG3_9RHOB|nr:UDP-3-O-(3-hydroxymyristoyl)glucosamine N-acyltransferase [Ketogulonicigenium robustum]ARO14193.1 UDP-3-O-(3-hydroxymyristoyl) glucosamine N-acyltransferase [Ketogulonicigenium robustum]
MPYRIDELAEKLGATFEGDGSITIAGAAEPQAAGADDLALAMSPTYAAHLAEGQAKAAVVWPGADWQALGLKAAVFAPRGRLAMAGLTALLDPGPGMEAGIHPSAIIDPTAEVADGVAIGPFSIIGARVRVAAGVQIGAQVSVGPDSVLGADTTVHDGVRIGRRVRIGARVIIQPNAVLGADGLSFVTASPAYVEVSRQTLGLGEVTVPEDATWHRIHSLGGVEIADDVEIGACTTIDSGTIRATRIGRGTKLDNLIHIAHNVVVGEDCLFAAQVGIAGSSVVGDRVVAGGKVGISDNITIGNDVVLGGASVILSSVPTGRVMLGYPATKMDVQLESYKALRRLPRVLKKLAGGKAAD